MSLARAGTNEPPTCHGGLENLDVEHDYVIDDIEGQVPADLTGTFFRNGPGRQRIGGKPYGHWFDGDGMLCAFTFADGRVHFRNRYVRTPKYVEETAAQKILYRGFGTQIPGGWTKNVLHLPANPANTNTVFHGNRLLALNEGGKPWELKPDTLDTVGEYTFDGKLSKSQVFSAHGKIHPKSGDYINFGAGMSGFGLRGPKPCLHLYRINAAGALYAQASMPIEQFPFCHDFVVTDRYAIFFVGSIVFGNMLPMLLGTRTISQQIRFDSTIPLQVIVCDLETLREVRRFETTPGAVIHFGNAFEDGDEIVVDAMFTDNFAANDTLGNVFDPHGRFGGGTYQRYFLNMASGALRCERVTDVESEFPTYNLARTGQRHLASYTACSIDNGANSFFNGIQRVDFDGRSKVVTLTPGHYGSEPLFVAADNAKREDDGYLLEVVYDAWKHRSELRVLRADAIDEQVCSLKLRHHVPHQFHGYFTPRVFAAA